MYVNGEGVPQDHIAAHMWSNLAAAQGNEMARENRDIIAAEMTGTQIAEAENRFFVWQVWLWWRARHIKLAREWTEAHAEQD